MFSTVSSEIPKKSLPMKGNDKFFSSFLSRESSMTNPSFRVYYGGLPGNVPFLWESQPGTPKHTFSDNTLPPLTPPPSYYSNNSHKKQVKKHSRSNLLHALFLKISIKKSHDQPQSPSSTESSFSSSKFSHLPMLVTGNKSRKHHGTGSMSSSQSSSFDSRGEYEEDSDIGSPTSTLCFRFRRTPSGQRRSPALSAI